MSSSSIIQPPAAPTLITGGPSTGDIPFGIPFRHAHFAFSPTYTPLNHGSYGTHPLSVRGRHLALRSLVESAPDPFIALNFSSLLEPQRRIVADEILRCDEREVAFVPNATTGIDTVLKNLRWEEGDVLLCYEVVYGSVANGLSWLEEFHTDRKTGEKRVKVEVLRVEWPVGDDELVEAYVDKVREVNSRSGEKERVRLAVVDTIVSLPGMRIPFEKLVPALKKEGAMVLVDGAHGAGHIDLDLRKLDPDFFVTNLHKWLFVPRGCAAFYVPKRNQHMIRTTLPTSHGFRPVKPLGEEEDGVEGFVEMFDFTGTNDTTNWLCVEEAMKFRREVCGGEEAIRNYCFDIVRKGADIVSEVFGGTEIMDHPKSNMRACNFANVRLPLGLGSEIPQVNRVIRWVRETAVQESGIYYQITLYHDVFYWRLSGMVYVEECDFRKGAEVLRDLCVRIRAGEHCVGAEDRETGAVLVNRPRSAGTETSNTEPRNTPPESPW